MYLSIYSEIVCSRIVQSGSYTIISSVAKYDEWLVNHKLSHALSILYSPDSRGEFLKKQSGLQNEEAIYLSEDKTFIPLRTVNQINANREQIYFHRCAEGARSILQNRKLPCFVGDLIILINEIHPCPASPCCIPSSITSNLDKKCLLINRFNHKPSEHNPLRVYGCMMLKLTDAYGKT